MADVIVRVVEGRAVVQVAGVPSDLLAQVTAAAAQAGEARDEAVAAAADVAGLTDAIDALPSRYVREPFEIVNLKGATDSFGVSPNPHTGGDSIFTDYGQALGVTTTLYAVSGRTVADGQLDVLSETISATDHTLLAFGQNNASRLTSTPDLRKYTDYAKETLASIFWWGIPNGARKTFADGVATESLDWADDTDVPGARVTTQNGAVSSWTATNSRIIGILKKVKNGSTGRANVVIDDTNKGQITFAPSAGSVMTNEDQDWSMQVEYFDLGRIVDEVKVQVIVTSPDGGAVSVVGFFGLDGLPMAGPLLAVCDLSERGQDGYDGDVAGGSEQAVPIISRINLLCGMVAESFGLRVIDFPLSEWLPFSTLAPDQFHPGPTAAAYAVPRMVARGINPQGFAAHRPDLLAQAAMMGATASGFVNGRPVLYRDGQVVMDRMGASGLFFKVGDDLIPAENGVRICLADANGNALSDDGLFLGHDGTGAFIESVTGPITYGAEGANRLILSGSSLSPVTNDAMSLGNLGDGKAYNYVALTLGVWVGGVQVLGGLGAAIANPTGGSVVDVEARAAIASILATMRDKKPTISPT